MAAYDELDAHLVSKGFPPSSPWWRKRIERFIRSRRKTSVWRVGRRGGKSSTICRVLVVLALVYAWPITPGDTGVIPIVSVDGGEATGRLVMIEAILLALEAVPFAPYSDPTSHGWKFLDRPVQFRVKTCSIPGTSGFTAIGVLADEMSKWRGPSDGKNPSKEIMTSLRAATANMPQARIFAVSSAFSTTDHHAVMVDKGDSEEDDQLVFIGATWECNPTLTEDDTHKLEPDTRKHDREYGSQPTEAGDNPWFDEDVVDAAIRDDLPALSYPKRYPHCWEGSIACIDTGFRRDACGLVILHWLDSKLTIGEVHEVKREPNSPPLIPSLVLGGFAAICEKHNVRHVGADLHYIETVREHMGHLSLIELPDGNKGKIDMFTATRDALRDGNAVIPGPHRSLAKQLKQVNQRIGDSATIKLVSPRKEGQHGDLASAYCGAVWLAINYPITSTMTGDLALTRGSQTSFENRQRGF
jgi:hypothetical protein